MNRLDEYLKLPYTLVLIPDLEEGGFTAYFPELKGCVTCGETYTEAVENAMDAKKEWITACIEEGLNFYWYPMHCFPYSLAITITIKLFCSSRLHQIVH